MCLLLFAYNCHPRYPLLLLANRDEFYRRPTAPAAPWNDSGMPSMIAGRDLEAGGTWAGIARGRVAAVTNVREAGSTHTGAAPATAHLSRGDIPRDFLLGDTAPDRYAAQLDAPRYRGFNALLFQLGEAHELVCAGNRHRPFYFSDGVHGISNGAPDAPWPKVRRGRTGLERLLQQIHGEIDTENFVRPGLALLQDRTPAAVAELPDTGVGPALELALSPLFVQIDRESFPGRAAGPAGYGTRASTLVAVEHSGRTQLWEQSYHNGQPLAPLRHFDLD